MFLSYSDLSIYLLNESCKAHDNKIIEMIMVESQ